MRTGLFLPLALSLCASAADLRMENARYSVAFLPSGPAGPVLQVSRKDAPAIVRSLRPSARIFFTPDDPGYHAAFYRPAISRVAGWKSAGKVESDIFRAIPSTSVLADRATRENQSTLRLDATPAAGYNLSLRIHLEPGLASPLIEVTLQARQPGWYSLAFDGLEGRAPESADFLYQPLTWSWKRFPDAAYLTPEAFATTAASFVNSAGLTEGVAPDPAEIPYRFATFNNSRFGLLLRNQDGKAQPMVVAPVPGGPGSKLETGQSVSFRIRYFQQPGDWYAGVTHLLRDVLHYRNERQNVASSLNQTLESIIDFAMDDVLSGWVPELKGSDYRFDVPGTVKNVSALHPLSIAILTGDSRIYHRRALPMTEYLMSREKYLFATDEKEKTQSPSHFMLGPAIEIGELTSLSQLTGGRSDGFRAEAERVFGKPRTLNLSTVVDGSSWQDHLAMYRLTGNRSHLDKARDGAALHVRDEISRFPTDFKTSAGLRDSKAGFYTDFGPRWMDLLELFEETGERRFLDAAITGARGLLLWLRSNPMAPDRNIVVNEGGKTPGVFPGRRSKSEHWEEFDTTSYLPQQIVPAWRTSLVGLPPEQGSTYVHGPIMLTHHAPWLLRLAHYSGDTLLRDAAYNAVLGRYANFPGYYFTSLSTTVYQRPDYPLRPYLDIKYNAIFFNHVWPHIAMLADFLVSDAFYRSRGQVNFPSAYSPGYAFLTSKVYGHKPGVVFGHKDVSLWLPKGAVQTSASINHLLGAGPDDLFIVLMNTGNETVRSPLRLNPDVIPWDAGHAYPVSILDAAGNAKPGVWTGGVIPTEIPAQGLVAVRIHGLRAKRASLPAVSPTLDRGYLRQQTGIPTLGTVTGMVISSRDFGASAFVYCDATEKAARQVSFSYRFDNANWSELTDVSYPYEFSVPVPAGASKLEFRLSGDGHQSRLFSLGESPQAQGPAQ